MQFVMVLAALAVMTGAGAGVIGLLRGRDADADEAPRFGWCFLAGSALTGLLLHVPLSIDGTISHRAFLATFVICLALAAGPGRAQLRRAGVARFFCFDYLCDLPLVLRAGAVVLLLLAASVVFTPFVGWDERAIYGLKARVLYDQGSLHVAAFTDPEYLHFHARYPLLVPLLEASLFAAKGSLDDVYLKALFVLFALSLLSIVTEEARRIAGARVGALWGLLLLSTPVFVGPRDGQGMAAYADVTLGAYVTGVAILLGRAARRSDAGAMTLAGVLLGGALMAKQEGVIWATALGVALAATMRSRRPSRPLSSARDGVAFAAPVLGFVAVSAAARRSIPASIWSERYGTVFDLEWLVKLGGRPLEILPAVAAELAGWRSWGWGWLLVLGGLLLLRRPKLEPGVWFWRATALLVFGAFVGLFVVTPYHVHWHLETAFRRLMLQLFPLALLILAEQVAASGWLDQGAAARNASRLVEPGRAAEGKVAS